MATSLLSLLGIDETDRKVAAGRRAAAQLADLIETLVRARRDRGFTQKDVAKEMETTQSAVSNFERIGGDPKVSTILRYANAIGARVRFTTTFNGQALVTPSQPAWVTAGSAESGMRGSAYRSGVYVAADRPVMVAQ